MGRAVSTNMCPILPNSGTLCNIGAMVVNLLATLLLNLADCGGCRFHERSGTRAAQLLGMNGETRVWVRTACRGVFRRHMDSFGYKARATTGVNGNRNRDCLRALSVPEASYDSTPRRPDCHSKSKHDARKGSLFTPTGALVCLPSCWAPLWWRCWRERLRRDAMRTHRPP